MLMSQTWQNQFAFDKAAKIGIIFEYIRYILPDKARIPPDHTHQTAHGDLLLLDTAAQRRIEMITRTRPLHLLLIEDNPGDIRLTQEAFKESSVPVLIEVINDGEEAVAYLHKSGSYADKLTPDLILLDLNLPKKDGREVLRELKADPVLKTIPVIILSTSNAESDILLCYQSYVNCYINKPVDFDHFFEIIRKIENFWLKTAFLPSLVR